MSSITTAFERLHPEKQQRILTAALAEFAEHGFEHASTNRIVEKANIGKGMLFHYFKSKRELFHYLVDYSIRFVTNEYIKWLDPDETDFIERYRSAARAKLNAYAKNEHVFHFLGSLYLHEDRHDLTDAQRQRLDETMSQAAALLFSNIDTSRFRDDVSTDYVLRIIRWSIEGFQREMMTRLKEENFPSLDITPYWTEFCDLLSVLRRVFYKEENHGHHHRPQPDETVRKLHGARRH